MSEYFTAPQGFIVAEVTIDPGTINGTGSPEMPILTVMLQMLFRSPKPSSAIFDFREILCRVSPFEGAYIAISLRAPLKIRLASGQEIPNHSVHLEIPIDHRRIALINRLRNGGDVKLRLDMELFADELLEIRGGPNSPVALGLKDHHRMYARVPVEIPKSKWAERVLEPTGFGKVHLLELPLIPIDSTAEIKESFNALQHAYKLEREGFYDDAVAACRKALEPFFERKKIIDEKGERNALVLKSSWQTRLGKATYDWLNASLIAVKQGADGTHHLSSSAFAQMEAQMLLAISTSLIAYAIKVKPDNLAL